MPKERWPRDPESRDRVKAHWHPTFGDRRQELVFIGVGLDQAAITAALDACLVPGETFEPTAWARLADPFPHWGVAA